MEAIFIYILKVNLLIALFYLVYKLALSKDTFYQYSRSFLLIGLFVSVLLPLITFTKIEYYEVKEVLTNSIENATPQMGQLSDEVEEEPILTNQEILLLIYVIICFGFFVKTLFDFFKLFKIIKVSQSEKKNKLVYINSNLVHTPFSFFNYIVFNEELINPSELENIIKHEEAHSMQKHSFDTLLAQFFIILFWFNPIVWMYRKSIVQNLEFLADSYAIQQVSDRKNYQKTMLKITTQASNIAIINTFNQSSIKKRIIMLNTNQSNQKNIWKYALVLPFMTAFMLFFQIETIAQEKIIKETKTKNELTTSYSSIITKNSTDAELKGLEKTFSGEHQKLKISDVQRNSNNEIIAIKLAFDSGKTYNQVYESISDNPIKNINIYVKTDKNNVVNCGFSEVNSETIISEEKVEILKGSDKYWSMDNMTRNGKEVVLIINGKIKGAEEKVKIPFDEELGEMKEITPAEFEKKFNKKANSDKYYYEVETVKSISNIENKKTEIDRSRKEIEQAKIDVKNEMKNATPEIKRARIEFERAKVELERAKVEMNIAKQDQDIAPEPQNGMQNFRKDIALNFKLPEVEKDITASIVAKFMVTKNGELVDITILSENPKDLSLGVELSRILKESSKWKPGTKNGKPADLYFVLPVAIQIQTTK